MEGVKKRAIIIWDVDINGDTEEVFNLHKLVDEYAVEFQQYLKAKNPSLAKAVTIEQHKAGVPQAERRGPTGELKEIVFRGTRGDNHRVKIPMRTSGSEQMISAGVKKQLQRARNVIGTRNMIPDEALMNLLQFAADSMMVQYNAGDKPQLPDEALDLLSKAEKMRTRTVKAKPDPKPLKA